MLQTVVAWTCVVAGAAALIWGVVRALQARDAANAIPPPVARPKLLSDTELAFFRRLEELLPGHRVFPQVSMGALLRTLVPESSSRFWPAHRQFGSKIVDFVICEPTSLQPLVVVELDDPSHDEKRAKDAQRDEMLAKAGLRSVRVDVREQLSNPALRARLDSALGSVLNGAGQPAGPPAVPRQKAGAT